LRKLSPLPFSSSLSSSASSFSSAIAGVGGGRNHSNKLDINISTAKASFGGGGYGGPPRNNNSSSGDGVEPAMSSMGLSALLRKRSGSFEYGIAQGGSSSIEMLNFVAFVCSRFLYLQYTAHLVLPYANSMMTTTGALMYILVSFLGWVASWGAKRTNYLATFRYYGHNSY
jgi:hypothetical protein